METVSFGIANYCSPCHAHCRYCLLSSCGKAAGVSGAEGMLFADRVLKELPEARPGVSGFYYIGYCMDIPDLPGYIRFSREHRSPGARFLQMNGFSFREDGELKSLMEQIRRSGVELIDLTFFGTEAYHDRFAGRKGDFSYLVRMLRAADCADLPVNISIPLIRENLDQMAALREQLSGFGARKFSYFLPHSKGRGRQIQDQRITRPEFESLPENIRASFVKVKHLTEAEWLASDELEEPGKRNLTLVLTPDNIARLKRMGAEEILDALESMDNRYLAQIPAPRDLAARYGDTGNRQLFRLRDLYLKWQQQYIAETGNAIFDMHDETHHFSVHYSSP